MNETRSYQQEDQMPFNPNEPQNGETVDADVLRNQFNALNDEIDAGPGPVSVTAPVSSASEAANLVPGDKANGVLHT